MSSPSPSRNSRKATPNSPSGAAEARRSEPGGAFAPFIRAYIQRSGAPEHIGWKVAVKDRLNALKNPYAHLKIQDISIEKVKASPMMWEPIRFLESCPSSDGACAVILTDEEVAKAAAADGRPPAWILGTSSRSEPSSFPGRDPVRPAGRCAMATRTSTPRPASPIPAARWTWPSCTCPSPGTSPSGWKPTASPKSGEGWRLVDDGETELGGALAQSTPAAGCSRATPSVPPDCSASPKRRTRCAARLANTRWKERRSRGHGVRRRQPVLQYMGGR